MCTFGSWVLLLCNTPSGHIVFALILYQCLPLVLQARPNQPQCRWLSVFPVWYWKRSMLGLVGSGLLARLCLPCTLYSTGEHYCRIFLLYTLHHAKSIQFNMVIYIRNLVKSSLPCWLLHTEPAKLGGTSPPPQYCHRLAVRITLRIDGYCSNLNSMPVCLATWSKKSALIETFCM